MTIYNSADELSESQKDELLDGLRLTGRKLREWREFGSLHSLTAEMLNADGVVVVRCDHEDRVTLRDGDETLDITDLVDGRR